MASTNETKVTGIPVPAEGTPEFEKMNRMARRAIPLVLIIFIFGILDLVFQIRDEDFWIYIDGDRV